jgi:hypothetical protein
VKKVIITLLLLIPTIAFGWSSPKEYCSMLASDFEAMADQFPIQVDRQTLYTGASAKFVNNRCHISFNYLLDQDVFIEVVQSGAKAGGGKVPSRERVITDFNAEHGRNVFKESMAGVVGKDIHEIAMKDFTSTSMHFTFDQGNIAPITVLVEDYISKYDDKFELCYVIEEVRDELMENAPLQIDPYTKFLFGSVKHIETGCIVEFKYEIDEREFIKIGLEEVAQISHGTISLSGREYIEYVNSGEGQKILRELFLSVIDEEIKRIGSLPFVNITFKYIFDKGNIDPVIVKF